MDDNNALMAKLDVDSMIHNIDSEMVPSNGMKINVEETTVVLGIESKARQLKESEMGCRDEEKKENDIEEVGDEEYLEEEMKNDGNSKEDVNIEENFEEDPKEEAKNDENREKMVIIEENNQDDPEEEVWNDENPKEEVNIEENNEEDPEEEVRNDENKKEEVIIEENYEDEPEEEVKNEQDATTDARHEGKLEAISKKKVSKLRKKAKMFKKKKIALRKKIKNALASTSKLDEDGWVGNVDNEMVSFPMLDKNNIPNDIGTGVVASEKNDIVDVHNGVAICNRLKMNGIVLGAEEKKEHEIWEVGNEENAKAELQNEGGTRNETKAKEKLEANSKKKSNMSSKIGKKKKKKTKKKKDLRGKNAVVVNNRENPESSEKKATKDKCVGMIFMCNSKTKKDCYHYQVLGLPASKRDIVLEIYEGMKLFLFDFDLKLIYGIYEAAGPGGYNIEPKAFNSAFPSQVRFSVLEDCLPLTEEKFKKIIKDNYYSKNKFNCQLNSRQVENLCELLRVATKGCTSKQLNGSQPAEAPAPVDRDSKRPQRRRKAESRQAEAPRPVDREPKRPRRNRKPKIPPRAEASKALDHRAKRSRRSRKAETHPFVDPEPKRLKQSPREETQNFLYGDRRHHGWEDERLRSLARGHLYPEEPVAYRREVYELPLEHPPPLHPLNLPLASSLLTSSERDVYRRDQLQYHDVRPLDVDLRRRDEFRNPLHQGDFNNRGSYLSSVIHLSYHSQSSSAAQPSEYYPPASTRPASTYHFPAAPQPNYRPYRPMYRYYP